MCVWVCAHMQVSTESRDIRSPGAGVAGGCEPPDMDAGNWTWVLYKSRCHLNGWALSPGPTSFFWSIIYSGVLIRKMLDHLAQKKARMEKRGRYRAVALVWWALEVACIVWEAEGKVILKDTGRAGVGLGSRECSQQFPQSTGEHRWIAGHCCRPDWNW